MAVISRDLGPVTAYAAAVNRGYTGTREEFEQLMASYASVAQQAGESASQAAGSADDAESSASAAAASASSASGSASAAATSAGNASASATAAAQSASNASGSATAAQTAQEAAEAAQAGAEAAVDGFDSAVTAAISDVNSAGTNQKELAKRQAEKSEAWAVGQISGEDVGVSDPAYHNNAKYYAEQAGESATTATTKAGEAATSATNAAASASAAAESARTLTIDSTLTQTGQAADAKAVGDAVDEINDVVFSETIVIDTKDTAEYDSTPSGNPQKFTHLYDFVEGVKYRLEVTINSAIFVTGVTNALVADTSRSKNNSSMTLNTQLLRINNSASHYINNGDVYTAEFTALSNDVNILLRYKFDAGSQDISVKCYAISDIGEDVERLSSTIEKNAQISVQSSRMLMGAHRGAEHFAPPNSVAAYELAGKMGFPWAWLAQIRWSADNTLYVMHDEDVSITTNGTGNLSELTDEYISSLLCNKIQAYDYSKFTEDDLRVPTLEKVIQICLRYGMKMCFRVEPFPNNMDTERNAAIWNNFVTLIKAYGIQSDWASYSAYNAQSMRLCLTLLGDVEICPFLGNTTTAQDYVDWFASRESFLNAKKAVLMPVSATTLEGVNLLHTNSIRIYSFTNSTTPTQEQMEQLAAWGVDILQNPTYARIPIVEN